MPSENNQKFREFLLIHMQQRNMSAREFAKFLGISNTSLNRFLDERNPTKPSIEAIASISERLGVSLDFLFARIDPSLKVTSIYPDAEALAIADRITKLDATQRRVVEDFIFASLKHLNEE